MIITVMCLRHWYLHINKMMLYHNGYKLCLYAMCIIPGILYNHAIITIICNVEFWSTSVQQENVYYDWSYTFTECYSVQST